jgi:hypothetical protein
MLEENAREKPQRMTRHDKLNEEMFEELSTNGKSGSPFGTEQLTCEI